ncbi:RecA-family ATPase [Porphyrobacter sp. LM 6]|nr:RecA-family ATPase [Porphyrobacter sp. LM 6]
MAGEIYTFDQDRGQWLGQDGAPAPDAPRGPVMGVEPLRAMDLSLLSGVSPRAVAFVIGGAVPENEVTTLIAPGGGNKTTLALMLVVAMAARLATCLGLVIEPAPAIYVGLEDSEGRLHWMLHHVCAALGVQIFELVGRLHLVSLRQEIVNGLGHFNGAGEFEPGLLYHQLRSTIAATGARLLVLDNLAHLFLGNENDRGQVTRFFAALNKLASDTECAILLLAHTNKKGEEYSGSTAMQNAVRSSLSIEREEGGDPEVRVLKVSKGNYVKPGEVTRFRWHDHYLIRPEDLPADIAATLAATSRATSANAAFLRCLSMVDGQGRAVSHSRGANYAPRVFAKMPEAKGFDQDDLEAAMERLLHLGVILADQEVGKYANRTARRGLKQVAELAQSPAQSPAQGPAQEVAQDAQNPSAQVHKAGARSTPPPSGEIEGDSGPPSIPRVGSVRRGRDWIPGDD